MLCRPRFERVYSNSSRTTSTLEQSSEEKLVRVRANSSPDHPSRSSNTSWKETGTVPIHLPKFRKNLFPSPRARLLASTCYSSSVSTHALNHRGSGP